MNKNEIILTLCLYTLMVLLSSSKILLNQIQSCSFVKNLTAELQNPFHLSTRSVDIAVSTNLSNPISRKSDYARNYSREFSNSMGVATIKKTIIHNELLNG